MARKDDQNSAQFETGFGASGGTFGGSVGGAQKSQVPQGGEFSTGFGGGTNAVSQIFRDGGMGGDDKRRNLMLGLLVGAALVIVGSAFYFFYYESDTGAESPTVATAPAPSAEGDVAKSDAESKDSATLADTEETEESEDGEETEELEEAEELVSSITPTSSTEYTYTEVGGGPVVSATAGTEIEVSRDEAFSVMYMTGTTNKAGQLRIPNPPPGKIFWRISGKEEVTAISISAPAKLNIGMKMGASIGANEAVEWTSTGDAAHFRLEFAGEPTFGSVAYSYATNKKSVTLNGISPGNYFVRLGGLNVASGRWEYTRPSSVEVK